MPPLAIAGGIMAAGSIGGAAIGSAGAGSAAQTQANAAVQAANIQAQEADKALQFQEKQYGTGQQELAPYLMGGTTALANLEKGLGLNVGGYATMPNGQRMSLSNAASKIGLGSLNFTPPTAITEQNDPGYQARLNLGTQAIENSAAARGDLLTGGEGRALTDYAQNYASNEYGNVYNRALTNNMTAYGRLASLAGLGQTTGTNMVSAGNNSANSIANTLMSLGQLQGQAYNNAGAARAAGTVASSNAWGGAMNNIGNFASMIPLMQMMNNGSIPSMDPNQAASYLGG